MTSTKTQKKMTPKLAAAMYAAGLYLGQAWAEADAAKKGGR